MKGTFNFSEYGFAGTFTDPQIDKIPRSDVRMNETKLMINAAVYLVGIGYNICIPLTDIIVENFNYNEDQLVSRVETRLMDFKV